MDHDIFEMRHELAKLRCALSGIGRLAVQSIRTGKALDAAEVNDLAYNALKSPRIVPDIDGSFTPGFPHP
jgi:hypothetical protein